MSIWEILPDGNRYRSFQPTDLSPAQFLDVMDPLRSGESIGAAWSPIGFELYEDKGESKKPIGHFPSLGGVVPLAISAHALEILYPRIKDNVEVLDLVVDIGRFYALNVFAANCLDHGKSVFKRFRDGGIMRVETYGFRPDSLTGKHIFRIPEIWSYTFVDDTFKRTVEENQLGGLLFYRVPET